MHPFHPGTVRQIELTEAFDTRSNWALIVTALPGEERAMGVSFVRQADRRHSLEQVKLFPGERAFYNLLESRIVHSKPEGRAPLLLIKACTLRYGNCSCWMSTLLYAYDPESDSFRSVFFGLTASDAGQATRFIDSGPLQGRVVVVTPAAGAAGATLGRVVEVYKRSVIGEYLRVLVYCSTTGCMGRDADSGSVIDSEMPEILRRLGKDQMPAAALSALAT